MVELICDRMTITVSNRSAVKSQTFELKSIGFIHYASDQSMKVD